MFEVSIRVSMTNADAASLAQWLGEALSNPDVQNSGFGIKVHEIAVVESDA